MSFEFSVMENLMLLRERLVNEREERVAGGQGKLAFGVKFLDDVFGGIYKDDLVLLGAKTGVGKTALATIIAKINAAKGKRVHFFALEAANKEIERRIKYEMLAEAFYGALRDQYPNVKLNYRTWYRGELDQELGKTEIEKELDLIMSDMFPNLTTFYKPRGQYTVEMFEKQFLAIQDSTDLVIVDHLHYFDSDDENENRAMKRLVMGIRDLALEVGKPVCVVAHMRKTDRKMKQLCPGLEDFMGSSDIAKICTKAITLAPCHDPGASKHIWPTYIRAAKQRDDSSVTRYIAKTAFNSQTNKYDMEYYLGKLSFMEDEAKWITEFPEHPWWGHSLRNHPKEETNDE